MIRAQVSWWPGNVSVGGTHVHHLVWGICALLIFGYIGVVTTPGSPWHEIVAVLFAIGTGLTLDEFALWLELKDVYWEKDGRKSIDAMIIAGCATGILLVGFSSWVTLSDRLADSWFRTAARRAGSRVRRRCATCRSSATCAALQLAVEPLARRCRSSRRPARSSRPAQLRRLGGRAPRSRARTARRPPRASGAHVGDEVGDGEVDLVADGRDHRHAAAVDGAGQLPRR